MNRTETEHDGVFFISPADVPDYVAQHNPVVLRPNKDQDTLGLGATNIGVSKGSTYDRVLIFPTASIKRYLTQRDATELKEPEKLYVAVTRARFSAAFVV